MKQLERESNISGDEHLNKQLGKKMSNPYYFNNRALQAGFNITLVNHHINHSIFKLTIKTNDIEKEIKTRCFINILIETGTICATLKNQNKIKYQTVFLAEFDAQDEDNQVLDRIELIINLKTIQSLTETDIGNIDVRSPLEDQIQK